MKIQQQTAVLLINLGTPDSPSTTDVRRYLTEFLNDPRVIDISALGRAVLVNGVIVPFRAPRSAKLYKEIWDENGSPLLFHSLALKHALQEKAGENYHVYLAMRYGNPSIKTTLETIRKKGFTRILVVPLYPQYASSTTGSSIEKFFSCISHWETLPEIKTVQSFYQHPAYLEAVCQTAAPYNLASYDHILFSFHGIPERHIRKSDIAGVCLKDSCCEQIHAGNYLCYKAGCTYTARMVAKHLGIPPDRYTICFQSRLGKTPWIKPYSDQVIKNLADKGAKKLLVFSPAFVADCLETVHEIGVEYDELFQEHGGEKVTLVPSLNATPAWVEALHKIISENC